MQQDLAELGRVFHPHAAVAESALVIGEQPLVGRVVQVNRELVGKIELDAAERITGAGRLRHAERAIRLTLHLEAHAREDVGVAAVARHQLILDDRLRHVPGRVDQHVVHRRAEQRRRRLRLAGDDLGVPLLLVVVYDPEREIRNIDHHIGAAEVTRQPAPALHIGEHPINLLAARRSVIGGERSRHARVLDAWLADRLVVHDLTALSGPGAQRGELRLQRLESPTWRIEAFEHGAGIGGLSDFAQDIGRRRRVIAVIDFRQHPVRGDAAGRQVAGIGEC